MMKTTRDIEITVFDVQPETMRTTITIPAGTRIGTTLDGLGKLCLFVDDVPLLVKLTGNSHDPIYRYAMLPDDAAPRYAIAKRPSIGRGKLYRLRDGYYTYNKENPGIEASTNRNDTKIAAENLTEITGTRHFVSVISN